MNDNQNDIIYATIIDDDDVEFEIKEQNINSEFLEKSTKIKQQRKQKEPKQLKEPKKRREPRKLKKINDNINNNEINDKTNNNMNNNETNNDINNNEINNNMNNDETNNINNNETNNNMNNNETNDEIDNQTNVKKKTKKILPMLNICFDPNQAVIEIGIDEVGRGPMFGRVYASAVVLPKSGEFRHCDMKDSKKFTSKKKIDAISDYIKENAIAWSVKYEDENVIDEINILQATQKAMHECINDIIHQLKEKNSELNLKNILLLIDGNYFKPYNKFNTMANKIETIKHHTIEQGDNKFTSIAAASILAKVSRDKYIDELCEEHPELIEKYKINTNKGYGSKAHMDGIIKHGITQWHRKTFGICRDYC